MTKEIDELDICLTHINMRVVQQDVQVFIDRAKAAVDKLRQKNIAITGTVKKETDDFI
jgi:hypothetical protein